MLIMMSMSVYAEADTIVSCDFDSADKYFENIDKAYSAYTNMHAERVDGEGIDGSGAFRLDAGDNSKAEIKFYNDPKVLDNINTSDKYTVSFYVKKGVDSNITGINIAYSYYKSMKYTTVPIHFEEISGEDYVKISAGLKIDVKTRFTLVLEPQGTGELFMDDFSISKTELPRLTESVPQNGSSGVVPTDVITAVFNKEIDEESITGAVLINGSSDIISEVSLSDDKKTCIIKLKDNLEYNASYTVSLTGFKDLDGMEAAAEFSFKTLDNTLPLEILSSSPADEEMDIPLDGAITIKLSSNISGDDFGSCFILAGGGGSINSAGKISDDTLEFTYSGLDAFCEYTFTIRDIENVFGNKLDEASIRFKTGGQTVTFIDYDTAQPKSSSNWKSKIEETEINAYNGKSMKVTLETAEGSNYQVSLEIQKGVLYRYSFMASCDQPNQTLKLALNLSEKYKALKTTSVLPTGGEYIRIEGMIYIAETELFNGAMLDFYGTTAPVYIDDITVIREEDFLLLPGSTPADGEKNAAVSEPAVFTFNCKIKGVSDVTLNGERLNENSCRISDQTLSIYGDGGSFENNTDYEINIGNVTDTYGRAIKNIKKSFHTIREFETESESLLKNGSERVLKLIGIKNNTGADRRLTLKIIAVKDGKLLKSVKKEINISGGDVLNADLAMDLSDVTENGYIVKGMVWDEEHGIMPVIKHVE